MNQLHIPVRVDFDAIRRKPSLGKAIEECIELGGLETKRLPFDESQVSKWKNGSEGIKWEKLLKLMDACGNDAPVLWMLHMRGYDLNSIRKVETATEQRARKAEERVGVQNMVIAELMEELSKHRSGR